MNLIDKIQILFKINKLWHQFRKAKTMTDWKTTLTAFATLLAFILAKFGLDMSTEVQLSIVTLGVFIIGLLARDSHK